MKDDDSGQGGATARATRDVDGAATGQWSRRHAAEHAKDRASAAKIARGEADARAREAAATAELDAAESARARLGSPPDEAPSQVAGGAVAVAACAAATRFLERGGLGAAAAGIVAGCVFAWVEHVAHRRIAAVVSSSERQRWPVQAVVVSWLGALVLLSMAVAAHDQAVTFTIHAYTLLGWIGALLLVLAGGLAITAHDHSAAVRRHHEQRWSWLREQLDRVLEAARQNRQRIHEVDALALREVVRRLADETRRG